MKTIIVPSVPWRLNPKTKDYEPGIDISPAKKLGNVVILKAEIPNQRVFLDSNDAARICECVKKYDQPLLVAMGDRLAFAIALHALWEKTGVAEIARWNNFDKRYEISTIARQA